MKTSQLFSIIVLTLFLSTGLRAQVLTGTEAEKRIRGSEAVLPGEVSSVPKYVKLKESSAFSLSEFPMWASTVLGMSRENTFELINTTSDELGYVHYRYQQHYNNIPVEGTMYILHTKDGKANSLNGELLSGISLGAVASVDESMALANALNAVNATTYKWQIPGEENHIKLKQNNPAASYFPKGKLVYVNSTRKLNSENLRLAWKFDIYAHEPMSRDYIYVDALTGNILLKKNQIHSTDTPGTAITGHSGTQNIISDSFSGGFRLQETGRGGGIRTFNMLEGTNYGNAVDFTDADNTWNNVNAQLDQYATDAHWGTEMTYDYYWLIHSRNSIDGSGMSMDSYVHYDNNYFNAFWNGSEATFGDGNNSPLVSVDIVAHEFTHGVTGFSSSLDYQDESGALNESFSDIFGNVVERWALPLVANWQVGEDLAGGALRSMSNPNAFGDPDTYSGTNWYTGTADNGGVHTNSGVQNFWFYLLSQGGSGVNDLGNAYNVTGIGFLNAAAIAYRNNTVYLTSTSQYADARFYAIQSAIDLFGACTPQVIATTNAWHAVGVGGVFVFGVTTAFTADVTTGCSVPFTVNFTNNSTNAGTYLWDFGDASTSTQTHPSHIYSNFGTYTVTLIGDGGPVCGSDTTIQTSYVVITDLSPTSPGASVCKGASATLTATGTPLISWYANPTGGLPLATGSSYTTPPIFAPTTYYVESVVPGTPGNAGPVNHSFGPGSNHNNTSTQYLEFDVYQPCTLLTAWVDAGVAGNKNFQLWDGAGNFIQTYTVNVPAGQNTITLNIPLSAGSYRIGGTQMNLYRNSAGAAFPYTFPGIASITGSSAVGRYYYLYNWTILPQCITNRNPVQVNLALINQAVFSYTNIASNYTFTSSSTTATQWWWNFGDGSPVVTVQNPSHTYLGLGPYTVMHVVSDGTCYDTSYQVVNIVSGFSELTGGISSVYPNPATDELFITGSELQNNFTVEIYDMLGQKVLSFKPQTSNLKPQTSLDISGLRPGVYSIEILMENKKSAGRFVKH